MPIKPVPNSQDHTLYYLICYDKQGNERSDDPDVANGILSHEVLRLAKTGQYTDIFFISHGWKGDIPAAIDQYNRWTAAMVACKKDIVRLKARPQGFKPLVIGLHWPSLPFGQEEHAVAEDAALRDFALDQSANQSKLYQQAEDTVADTELGRQAVCTLLESALKDSNPAALDESTEAAINYLLSHELQDEAVNAELAELDAQALYQAAQQESEASLMSFGLGGGQGPLLGLVSQLSIWKMKERARSFGENGGAQLLRKLMLATNQRVQFHLMGHSLGTIVVASTVTGKQGREPLPRPVNTIYLVQGAVSFWAFCKDIPVKPGTAGYYQHLADPRYLKGPILITRTENDTAVKTLYVLAMKVSMDQVISFDPNYPVHGGLGMFGARGTGINTQDLKLLPLQANYAFKPNTFFNLQVGEYVKTGSPLTGGAHNDIAHPELAHAFWSAIH
ncbi:hypothetical protein [Thiothrix eikelboomii]|uniref:hypothetical protein n=1 Tax=Thiothrix eikelboomii TaxID=92487 RepID=UPI003BB0A425